MFFIVAIVVGAVLLGRAGKAATTQAIQGSAGPVPGQYSETGNAPTQLHRFRNIPDGSPTFTPAMQVSNANWTLPIQLVGSESADPSVGAIRATFANVKPTTGLSQLVGLQAAYYSGGRKF